MAPIQRIPVELKRVAIEDDALTNCPKAKEAIEYYQLGERRFTGVVRTSIDLMTALREAVVNSSYAGDWLPWFSRVVITAYDDDGDRAWLYRLLGDAVAYTKITEVQFLTARNKQIVEALSSLCSKYGIHRGWSFSLTS